MRVYRFSDKSDAIPYLDNCYIGEKRNVDDVDSTTTFSLYEFFRVGQIDYLQFRKYCKTYILPLWETLSSNEKRELVKHNIAPSEEIKLDFYDIAEQLQNYINIVDLEIKARQSRWNRSMKVAAFDLLNNQLAQLQMYNDAKEFKDDYIDADLPHLVLWLSDGAYPPLGIDYTNNGFGSKVYYNEAIKNKVLDILTL